MFSHELFNVLSCSVFSCDRFVVIMFSCELFII